MGRAQLIVLDTHAWIWYATESPKLSRVAAAAIRRADVLGVHPVSCWEVMLLADRGRVRFKLPTRDWILAALARPKVEVLPFTPAAAMRAAQLGEEFPSDPADRFIAAAALEEGAPLVTRDARIAAWQGLKVIW